MKKSFILYTENIEAIDAMSNEDAGILIKVIFAYVATGEAPVGMLPPSTKPIFALIKSQIDRNQEAYEAQCEKRKEAAAKRWMQKDASASNSIQQPYDSEDDNEDDSEYEHDNDSDNESPKGDKERKELKLPKRASLPPMLDEVEVVKALEDFKAMRKAKKKPMTVRAEELLIKDLTKLSEGDPIMAVKILEQSTMNSWTGIFALKEQNKTMTIKERLAAL